MKSEFHSPRRTELLSISDDGSRNAIHPADTNGKFTFWRRLVAWSLIAFYASLPWIPVNGYPAIFLDTDAMRFHFMGLTFVSQDLWLAFFLISGLGFGLFYVTALFGRIWCGWACPQTVFLEHAYRRLERLIEGDAPKRRKIDAAPWGLKKILIRGVKHGAFAIISVALAHMFMAYFLSVPQLWDMMRNSPTDNWGVFLFVFVYSAGLYFNFAWFREQLCIVICPYGRLQSALIDDNSVVIGYDEKRGEPRGKATIEGIGDCIDCNRCVQVCPTGIDIRQGMQMECIGCANCIDACDSIMDKVKRARGLVRYDSMRGLEGSRTKWIRPRIVMYSFLLVLGVGVMLFSLRGLSEASMTVWRVKGPPFYIDEEYVRNQYMMRVTNRRNEGDFFSIMANDSYPEAVIKGVDEPFFVDGNGDVVKALIVLMPKRLYTGNFQLDLQIVDADGDVLAERPLEFIGPDSKLLKLDDNR